MPDNHSTEPDMPESDMPELNTEAEEWIAKVRAKLPELSHKRAVWLAYVLDAGNAREVYNAHIVNTDD